MLFFNGWFWGTTEPLDTNRLKIVHLKRYRRQNMGIVNEGTLKFLRVFVIWSLFSKFVYFPNVVTVLQRALGKETKSRIRTVFFRLRGMKQGQQPKILPCHGFYLLVCHRCGNAIALYTVRALLSRWKCIFLPLGKTRNSTLLHLVNKIATPLE